MPAVLMTRTEDSEIELKALQSLASGSRTRKILERQISIAVSPSAGIAPIGASCLLAHLIRVACGEESESGAPMLWRASCANMPHLDRVRCFRRYPQLYLGLIDLLKELVAAGYLVEYRVGYVSRGDNYLQWNTRVPPAPPATSVA